LRKIQENITYDFNIWEFPEIVFIALDGSVPVGILRKDWDIYFKEGPIHTWLEDVRKYVCFTEETWLRYLEGEYMPQNEIEYDVDIVNIWVVGERDRIVWDQAADHRHCYDIFEKPIPHKILIHLIDGHHDLNACEAFMRSQPSLYTEISRGPYFTHKVPHTREALDAKLILPYGNYLAEFYKEIRDEGRKTFPFMYILNLFKPFSWYEINMQKIEGGEENAQA